jgi:hypothetical protein
VRDHHGVSSTRILAEHDGLIVRAVRGRHPRSGPVADAGCEHAGVVLIRRGCFIRECDGRRQVLDVSMVYLNLPGSEQRFAPACRR